MATEECRSCRAPIYWCEKFPVELNDKRMPKTMPINADSIGDPTGKVEVWSEPVIPTTEGRPAYVLHFRYLNQTHPVPDEGHKRAISHFATCKQADSWRNNPRSTSGWPAGSNGEAAQ